jgi:Concanavalin A-like lectin/glucanases superfamily
VSRHFTSTATTITGLSVTSTGSHTVACWINTDNAAASTTCDAPAMGTTAFGDYFWLGLDFGAFFFEEKNGGSTVRTNGSTSAAAGVWHHIAGVYNGSTIALYVDGVAEGTPQTFSASGRGTFVTGDIGWGAANIQDICLIDGALSASQIQTLMRVRNPALASNNKVLCWLPLFDDNRGADLSGNGVGLSTANDGTGTLNAPTIWLPTWYQAQRTTSSGISITASGTTNVTGAAATTESAGLVASGTTNVTGAAATSESAGLVATGTTNVTGAASSSESAGLVATSSTQVTGAAATTESAALVATGTTQVTGAAASTESAGLVASGTTNVTGAADVTSGSAGSITATGTTNVTGAAAMTGSADLVASGSTQVTGAASASSTAALAATGSTQVTGAASATSAAALVASGTTNVTGAATVTYAQVIPITAAGTTNVTGAASFDGAVDDDSWQGNNLRRMAQIGGMRRSLRR